MVAALLSTTSLATALLATALLATALLATALLTTVAMPAAWAAARPVHAMAASAAPASRGRQPATGQLAGPIYSRIPGVCLSYYATRAASRLVAGIGHCSSGRAQQWMLPPGNTVQVAGRCLQAAGTAARSRVTLARCNGSASQFWETDGVVRVPGVELLNPASGMCLEDPGGATADGTPVQISACAFSSAQTWYPPPSRPGPVPAPPTGPWPPPPGIAYPLSAGPAGAAGGG